MRRASVELLEEPGEPLASPSRLDISAGGGGVDGGHVSTVDALSRKEVVSDILCLSGSPFVSPPVILLLLVSARLTGA